MERLAEEAGGHRIQRVPHNERQGRMHSSTVTVAVLDPQRAFQHPSQRRAPDDFEVAWFNGTVKAGGQFRNKTATSCRLTHKPSGLIRTAQTRSRENSRKMAQAALEEDLDRALMEARRDENNVHRKADIGSGERSDRRRVWMFQRDLVEDLLTGKTLRCSDALRGRLEGLWNEAA